MKGSVHGKVESIIVEDKILQYSQVIETMIVAFLLGLIGGVVPGPALAATFTEILQSGFLKCLRIILLAMLTETAVALFSMSVLTSLHLPYAFFAGLSFVGAGVLIWIASMIWKIREIDSGEKVNFTIGRIISMILANGVLWTFWITVCIPKAVALGNRIFLGQYLFLMLVEIGWLISTIGAAVLFSTFRKALSNPRVVPLAFKLFALTFVYFALEMTWGSMEYFMRLK